MFAALFAHQVKYAQNEVKNRFTAIATAEQSFVDRMIGGNGVYWTPDLAGLYRYQPSTAPINLINSELARLDAHPANFTNEAPLPPAPAPNEHNLPEFGFAAVRGADGAVLDAHHYAFCAWPLGYGRVGRQTYLLVDPGNLFVKDTEGKPVDRLPANLEADGWTSIDFQRPVASAAAAVETPAPVKPVVTPEVAFADADPSVRIDGLNRLMGVADEHAAPPSDPAARQISPAAAKALAAMFGDKNEFVRRRACEVAQFFGKPAIAEAKPFILQGLKSEDPGARRDALLAVKDLKIRSDEVAAIIVRLTASDDHDESNYAFDALVVQKLDDATTRQMIVDTGDRYRARKRLSDGRRHPLSGKSRRALDRFRRQAQGDRWHARSRPRPLPAGSRRRGLFPYHRRCVALCTPHISLAQRCERQRFRSRTDVQARGGRSSCRRRFARPANVAARPEVRHRQGSDRVSRRPHLRRYCGNGGDADSDVDRAIRN